MEGELRSGKQVCIIKSTIHQKEKSSGHNRVSGAKTCMLPKQEASISQQYGHGSVLSNDRIAKIDSHNYKMNKTVARSLGKRFQDNTITARQ